MVHGSQEQGHIVGFVSKKGQILGIALPHYTGYQYQRGTKINPSEMQRGDLIFYGPGASQHVAIYLGDGMMIEAPSSGSTVQVSPVRWSGMTEYAVRLI